MLGKCFELPSIADHGWKQNAKIWWIKEPFPKDKEEILFSVKYNENEANDEEDESGNEGDQFLTSENWGIINPKEHLQDFKKNWFTYTNL